MTSTFDKALGQGCDSFENNTDCIEMEEEWFSKTDVQKAKQEALKKLNRHIDELIAHRRKVFTRSEAHLSIQTLNSVKEIVTECFGRME